MMFSKDDFQCNLPRWESIVENFPKGRPISYLELGVFEGRSFFWLVKHLFSRPEDRAVAVDKFQNTARDTFFANLEECERKHQVRVMEMDFRTALIQLHVEQQKFDFIYEDGTHVASETMETLCLAWPLLKVDGILVIDDYEWNRNLPTEFTNSFAVDTFLKMHRQEVEIIQKSHQIVVRKLKSKRFDIDSVEIGDWIYRWFDGVLFHLKFGKNVSLDAAEKKKVENIFSQEKWESLKDRVDFEKQVLEQVDLQNMLEEKERSILSK